MKNTESIVVGFILMGVCLGISGCGSKQEPNSSQANLDPNRGMQTEAEFLKEVQTAIDKKRDLNALNRSNGYYTFMHEAAISKFNNAIELLIKNGADINSRDRIGATPLDRAVQNGFVTTASILIKSGANIEARDNSGFTALMFSVMADSNNEEVVKLLLDSGAKVNVTDDSNNTPLHWAGFKGQAGAAELLIKAGADVNSIGSGESPLHTAAVRGKWKVVEVLLKHGANVNALNYLGHTPLNETITMFDADHVRPGDRDKAVEILRAHGGIDK
jgi:ankyrin repeat protein